MRSQDLGAPAEGVLEVVGLVAAGQVRRNFSCVLWEDKPSVGKARGFSCETDFEVRMRHAASASVSTVCPACSCHNLTQGSGRLLKAHMLREVLQPHVEISTLHALQVAVALGDLEAPVVVEEAARRTHPHQPPRLPGRLPPRGLHPHHGPLALAPPPHPPRALHPQRPPAQARLQRAHRLPQRLRLLP